MDLAESKTRIKELSLASRNICFPMYWVSSLYDPSSFVGNGTCFFLRTPQRTFGVTASHVIEDFEKARSAHRKLFPKIGDLNTHDFDDLVIDRNPSVSGLDLCTFALPDDDLQALDPEFVEYDPTLWERPESNRGVILTGYPYLDVEHHPGELIFLQIANALGVARVERRDRIILHAQQEHLCSIDGSQIPDIRRDLGGLSGAPFLIAPDRGTTFRFGGVYFDWGLSESSESADVAAYRAIHPSRINADGTLNRVGFQF